MAKSTIELENANLFADALKNINMGKVMQETMMELTTAAQKLAEYRPTQMGYSGNALKPTSSGNSIVGGKTFWKRGDGAYYVAKQRVQKVTKFRNIDEDTGKRFTDFKVKMVNALKPVGKLRSDDLQGNWNTRISQNMLVVEVVSEGVRYAGAVHGGADDTMRQSAAMKRRGWLSVDEMAKKVDSKVAQSAAKVVARAIADYLASRGVTAAAS